MIQVVIIEKNGMDFLSKGKKKIFQCPLCKNYNHFYSSGLSHCLSCHKELPNVYALIVNDFYRKKWHAGEYS